MCCVLKLELISSRFIKINYIDAVHKFHNILNNLWSKNNYITIKQ